MKKTGSLVLSVLLLLACIIPAYAETSAEPAPATQEDFTLEEMVDAWERRDMEQLRIYYEALDLLSAYDEPAEQPTITPYWQSGGFQNDEKKMCHKKLTVYGFLMYLGEMQKMYNRPLNSMGFTLDDLEVLMQFSEEPDVLYEEMKYAYEGHFYDPDTGKNFVGQTNPTAKTRAAEHYDKAIQYHNQNIHAVALQELGMALHYLQDINEPHHASNITAPGTNHKEFEAFVTPLVDDLVEMFEVTDDRSFYDGYINRSVSASAHDAAVSAKRFVELATNNSANKEDYWKLAALFTVAGSISCTSALIYRFAKQTHLI